MCEGSGKEKHDWKMRRQSKRAQKENEKPKKKGQSNQSDCNYYAHSAN
jgi:hypothetical protein